MAVKIIAFGHFIIIYCNHNSNQFFKNKDNSENYQNNLYPFTQPLVTQNAENKDIKMFFFFVEPKLFMKLDQFFYLNSLSEITSKHNFTQKFLI